ncbi:FG-GAP repeat domain-containing protein [Thalassoglobus sp.]|uniref:FG-GAP repeat domain-containing protein n=1 Tax=Thalassoglobus sp. TaxID=2795869 RepID=UPI003AA93F99
MPVLQNSASQMLFLTAVSFLTSMVSTSHGADPTAWVKHTLFEGGHCNTVVAGDFTGDGLIDVISNSQGKCHLLIAPDWKHVVLHENPKHNCIHSEVMDVDQDGDLDYIAVRYNPGLIFWLENNGTLKDWKWRLIDDQVHGIHGLLVGDVDQNGVPDLIANSGLPKGPFQESVVWYRAPKEPEGKWTRTVAARKDAPGLTHYLGLGDVNHDGRPDILTAAKGGPQAKPGSGDWFAWWEAPKDPLQPGWKKHLISDKEPGASNLFVVDVDQDGRNDILASRGHGKGLCWFKGPNWERTDFGSDLEGPHCLTIADFDADGDMDAATCAKDSKITAWFENDGQGNFTTHKLDEDQAAYDIRSLDMDGDGDLDLLVAGQTSKNVVWYENRMNKE